MRDYDPTTGWYLQADPLGLVDGASVYGYAVQNPMMKGDPSGECVGLLALVCMAARGVITGFVIDYCFGDGCYTLDEAMWDAGFGIVGGVAFKGLGIGFKALRSGRGAADDALRSAASYGPGPSIQAAADAARAAGLNARQIGNAAHHALTAWVNAFKLGWQAGLRIVTPSGRVIVPDVVTRFGRFIDLKPNTLTGRLAGEAKAAYYYALTGIRTRIIYYN